MKLKLSKARGVTKITSKIDTSFQVAEDKEATFDSPLTVNSEVENIVWYLVLVFLTFALSLTALIINF